MSIETNDWLCYGLWFVWFTIVVWLIFMSISILLSLLL